MRTGLAEVAWLKQDEDENLDRAPGLPLLGFLSGTVISLALWIVISWVAFRVFA